jgi:hypothetical protein
MSYQSQVKGQAPGKPRLHINFAGSALAASALALAIGIAGDVLAKGGTAKPPQNAISPFVTPTLPDPVFSLSPTLIHGFDVTGFIEDATVDGTICPGAHRAQYGGSVKVNGLTITVPCNSVIQMPANTLAWADFVNGGPSLALKDMSSTDSTRAYPSFEIQVIGNSLGDGKAATPLHYIAGLIYISQQSLNTGSGTISRIDHATGNIEVSSRKGKKPVVLQINDPNGRFGRAQSPDPRFSVDDQNPTIHAATGYPMCVPRIANGFSDPLCPQFNRPKAINGCRNFSQAGVVPPVSGELSPPAADQVYCSQYVMKSVTDRVAGDPDPRRQAPFEVGDYITWSGTLMLMKDSTGAIVLNPDGSPVSFVSAHTIEANVGIYTQPGTQPSYLAIGEFGVGTADPLAAAVNGAAQETQDRIVLEASTTDILTPVDIYYVDIDPVTGAQANRWLTPYEMTGECAPTDPTTGVTTQVGCYGISGGITTQFTGPQPQRARIRATKAPTGLLSQPTRTLRIMVRSLCVPEFSSQQPNLDACLAKAAARAANFPVTHANGLVAGQYLAPVFEYIFPEGVKPGDPVVPNDFWHLPFLVNGEGPGVGPLAPTPW